MVRKLFIYTGIVIWHFEKAKKRKKKHWNFNICNYFCGKCYFGLYFTAEMEFGKELITSLKILLNHNFVRYRNSMVWKLGVYV